MDQKKKEAITGLVIGFIGFLILFIFSAWDLFGKFRIYISWQESIIYEEIGRSFSLSNLAHKQEKAANFFYFISLPIYLGLVWYYRNCVGYWFYKIIRMVYKKI